MNLPMQSEPVQRSTIGQPSPYGGANGETGPEGIIASEHGLQPSFDWGGLAAKLIPIAATTLGSLI